MKRFLLIAMLILLGAASCSRVEAPAPAGGCELRIDFGTGCFVTRNGTPGDGVVADGGGIYMDGGEPDLVILIANNASGAIVGKYTDPVPDEDVDSSLEPGAAGTGMSVKFTGLDEGAYTVYAFANTGGYWPMEGQGVSSSSDYLLSLSTSSAVQALRFSDLFATVPASVSPNDDVNAPERLPLSAKGTVNVSSLHTGEVTLEMLRCVAKVTTEFLNNTGENLTLYDFSNTLVGLCPNRGYVIEGSPDYPAGTLAGNLLAEESSISIPAFVDPLNPTTPGSVSKSWYVFPSSGPYTCNIGFTLFKGDPEKQHVYTYSNLPVHDDHAISIPSLPRNRHLHIVTKISKGTTVSFNFEVAGWGTPIEETVLFD